MGNQLHWTWQIMAISERSIAEALPLDPPNSMQTAWEPFGVTMNAHGEAIYHLRRKVRK